MSALQWASTALYTEICIRDALKVKKLIGQDYKGTWPRPAAQIVDGIVLLVVFVPAIYVTFRTIFADIWMIPLESYFYASAIFASIQFLYFSITKKYTGTTVGKKALKTKVTKEDGSACGIGSSLIRNILRFVDAISYPLYFARVYWVDKSPKRQRLGDRGAHTVVISTSGSRVVASPRGVISDPKI